MKDLDKTTLKDFKEGIIYCLGGGLTHHAPLGRAGGDYLLHGNINQEEQPNVYR